MPPLADRLTPHEKLFAKVALKKGLIDRVRLDDCVERHAGEPIHVGLVLCQEGLLESEGLLSVLRTFQKYYDRDGYADEFRREDELVRRLAVQKGLVEASVAQECAEIQTRMSGKGVGCSYAWVLIQKGILAPEDYLALLKLEDGGELPVAAEEKVVARCDDCGSSFRVRPKARRGKFNCPNCQSVIVVDSLAQGPLATEDRNLQATREAEDPGERSDSRRERTRATLDTAEARAIGGSSTAPPVEGLVFDKENFAGDYAIEGEIARGGMGIVYKARQKSLDRIVALKILKEGAQASKASIKRFIREAQAAAKLDHPHIVAIHQVSEQPPYFFTMAYIEGDSLDNMIRKKRLSLRRGAEILEQVARAVHFAHGAGIVHRDLKPANILVDAEGVPKITDFGLAKSIDFKGRLTQSGYAIGTPYYMSPEQARGDLDRIGPRSDVYNLGVILYEMLAGRVPFMGRSNVEIYEKIRHEEPRPPREFNNAAPKELQIICQKAMLKEPASRYRSAKDLADDLRRYLDGEPIQARPVGMATKVVKKMKKHKTTTAVAGLASVIIGLLTLVILSLYLQREGATEERVRAAEESVAAGDEALARYDLSKAYDQYDKALRIDDRNPAALRGRGKANYYLRNLANAEKDLRRAGELAAQDPETQFYLGATLLRLGQEEGAVGALERAIQTSTEGTAASTARRARSHYYAACAYARARKLRSAMQHLDLALEDYRQALVLAGGAPAAGAPWPGTERTYFLAHLTRGVVFLAADDVDRALAEFEQAIQIRPRHVEAHLLKSLALWRGGHYESALDSLVRIEYVRADYADAHPDFVDEILDGGAFLGDELKKGLEPRALSEMAYRTDFEGMMRDPSSMTKYFHQEVSKLFYKHQKGDYELVVSNLNSLRLVFNIFLAIGQWTAMMGGGAGDIRPVAVAYKTTLPRMVSFISLGHLAQGDLEEARTVLKHRHFGEERLGPAVGYEEDPIIHAVRGMAEHRAGEFSRAIQHYERATQLDPTWVRLHVLAGKSHLALYRKEEGSDPNRLEQARREFERALDADPGRYEAAYFLGEIAYQAQDSAGVARWWGKAIEIEPRLLALKKKLDDLQLETGD